MQQLQHLVSITEDDTAVREGLQLIVERAGYQSIAHANSNHIFDATAALPDIYIIDRQLSGIDGLDACRHLKAGASTSSIPVIIISATPHVQRLAAAVHADGFLEKPFQSSKLLDMIRVFLENKR